MKNVFPRFFALWLLAFVFAACGSDDKPADPQPQNGTVTGQFTPANSITSVQFISSSNQTSTVTPTSTTYTISLPAGSYTMRFVPAQGYTAPREQMITVSAGGTTTPTPTTVTQSGGTATLSINGTAAVVSVVRAEFAFGDLNITLQTANGQSLVLRISPYSGTARTGTFSGFGSTRLLFTEAGAEWAVPSSSGPTGSYSVTPSGSNPVRVSGDFSCTLQPFAGGASGPKTVVGTFTNVAY